jgi:signal transduction histidine kinase/CheY-like chemotaxis protein
LFLKDEVMGMVGLANPQQEYGEALIETLDPLLSLSGRLLDEGRRYREADAQRRKQEEATEAASEAKSAFVAYMSHEIRTPLSGLIGLLGLINETSLSNEDQGYLQTARTTSVSLLSLLNDVLDLSKIEARQLTLEEIPFDPRTVAQDVVQLLSLQAQQKGLDLALTLGGSIPKQVIGDPTRLRQIFLNLGSNAVKFTEKGSVTFVVGGTGSSTNNNNGRFILEGKVIDTGIGMSTESQEQLFKPFAQANASMTRRFGGTGLGLFITKQLCEMMGGDISVKSELGKGATFSFRVGLPLPENAANRQYPDSKHEKSPKLPPLHILVAEDNVVNQMVLKGILERAGCSIKAVFNGREAVEALQREHYDLVLMDGHMPEMDGIEATRQIRCQGFDKEILPIIGITARVMMNDREDFLASGMNSYLTKPIQAEALKAEILRCLQKRR